MSYDLFFCREKGAKLEFREVASWLLRREHFKQNSPTQIWYENPATGVYFAIEHDKVEDEGPVPPEYEDVELAFNINFNRPSFFAYEAMPIVEAMVIRFSMLVIDDYETPNVMNAQELIESWCNSNYRAIGALRTQKGFEEPFFMPKTKSLNWWKYALQRGKLQSDLGDDIFAPTLSLFRRKESKEVQTLVTWVTGIPTIIPDSDLVAVVRERKRLLRPTKKEVGIVSAELIREIAGEFLESYDASRSLQLLPDSAVERAERALLNMDLKENRDEFVQVASDGFVDQEALQ